MCGLKFRLSCAGLLSVGRLSLLFLGLALRAAPSDSALPAQLLAPEPPAQAITATMAVKEFKAKIRFGPLSAFEQSNPPEGDETTKGKLRIGLRRSIEHPLVIDSRTLTPQEWILLPDKSRLWSAEVFSEGARGLRLHLQGVKLPEGARFVVAPAMGAAPAVSVTGKDLAGASDIWLPSVLADRLVFECQVPESLDIKDVAFAIDAVSHLYETPVESLLKVGSCNHDVACYPLWANPAAGVGRIAFVENGNTYLCTGALLADNNPSTFAAFFLTANHCVPNQAVASSLEVYWLFQAAQCGGTAPRLSEVPKTSGGADFLAGTGANDFTLLRLRHSPPSGVFYLGWTAQPLSVNEAVTTIHHPGGTQKRISFGQVSAVDAVWWRVKWSSGVTEPGSSGAPLFNSRQEVVGQLYGGSSSCGNPGGIDSFGRLDAGYAKLRPWLDPDGSAGGEPEPEIKVPRGNFTGLFGKPDGLSVNTSGSIGLLVGPGSRFTGSIRMNSGSHPFTGRFTSTGRATATIRRRHWSWLTLNLQVSSSDPDVVTGTIGDETWTSNLTANRAVFNGTSQTALAAGRYTLGLPGGEGQGDGFAVVTVAKTGRVLMAGKMGDGSSWSRAGKISKSGDFPLYYPLYGGRGMVCGWIAFEPDAGADPHGDINWTRPVLAGAYYDPAFSREISVVGSPLNISQAKDSIFSAGSAQVILSGAGLSEALDYLVEWRSPAKVLGIARASGKVNLALHPNGSFGGRLVNSPELGSTALRGVILSSHQEGLGFFLHNGRSGVVELAR